MFVDTIAAWIGSHLLELTSFAISVYVLWSEKLKGFRLTVRVAGRVGFMRHPWSANLRQDGVFVDLLFENQGTRRGSVDAVALLLRWDDQTLALVPHSESVDRSLNVVQPPPPPQLQPFTSFTVPREEIVEKRIFFVPYLNATEFHLRATAYEFEVVTRINNSPTWNTVAKSSFILEEADVETLALTTMTPDGQGGYHINLISREKFTALDTIHLQALNKRSTGA